MFHLVQSTPYSPSYFHNTFLPKMIVFNPGKTLLALFLAGVLLAGFVPKFVVGQCNCPSDQCCSKYGYCGLGNDYCGDGCQAGPCNAQPATNTVSVADVVTDAFFNGIVNKATGDCPGKGFFTRATFLDAVGSYAEFGRVGSVDDSKREIAAFFAHVTLETGFLCKKEEDNRDTYCDTNYPQYPCNPNKQYYGRGPLQLTWNYNYAKAGSSIGFDGLGAPETVANDAIVSFKASLWYWMQECHSIIISGKGFGETIRAINGNVECNKGVPQTVQNRVAYYQDYCSQFGVSPGDNLTC